MIANASTMLLPPLNGARTQSDFARVAGPVRDEARAEVGRLFYEVSGKRIEAANVPGATRNSISRAANGCESNPVWRLAGWFVLCRRLGVPKSRLQRIIDWLQTKLDEAYGDVPQEPLNEVLDRDAELDGRDELPRQRAARGCKESLVELLEIEREQYAHSRHVVTRLSAEVTTYR